MFSLHFLSHIKHNNRKSIFSIFLLFYQTTMKDNNFSFPKGWKVHLRLSHPPIQRTSATNAKQKVPQITMLQECNCETLREKSLRKFYSGIICSLSASPSCSMVGFDGAWDPGACFCLIPLTMSSILRSIHAASMAVLKVCASTL